MTLNGIDLQGLVISDNLSFTGVRTETAKTLAGGSVVWEQREYAGQSITLVGGDTWGCLQYSTLKQIYSLAKVVGGRYILDTGTEFLTVRFMNEAPPVIDGKPIVSVPNPSDTDWFQNITIKLMVE